MSRKDEFKIKHPYQYLMDWFILINGFSFGPILTYLERSEDMLFTHREEAKKTVSQWGQAIEDKFKAPMKGGARKKKYKALEKDFTDNMQTELVYSLQFPNILYYSIYLTLYSMFEYYFFKICNECRKLENLKLGPKDLKGNGVGQCRAYLTKVVNVNLDPLNEVWAEITKYQLIRNSIVHNNGNLEYPKGDIIKFIADSDGISLDMKTSKININSIVFLKTFHSKIYEFLEKVIKELIKQKKKGST